MLRVATATFRYAGPRSLLGGILLRLGAVSEG